MLSFLILKPDPTIPLIKILSVLFCPQYKNPNLLRLSEALLSFVLGVPSTILFSKIKMKELIKDYHHEQVNYHRECYTKRSSGLLPLSSAETKKTIPAPNCPLVSLGLDCPLPLEMFIIKSLTDPNHSSYLQCLKEGKKQNLDVPSPTLSSLGIFSQVVTEPGKKPFAMTSLYPDFYQSP